MYSTDIVLYDAAEPCKGCLINFRDDDDDDYDTYPNNCSNAVSSVSLPEVDFILAVLVKFCSTQSGSD